MKCIKLRQANKSVPFNSNDSWIFLNSVISKHKSMLYGVRKIYKDFANTEKSAIEEAFNYAITILAENPDLLFTYIGSYYDLEKGQYYSLIEGINMPQKDFEDNYKSYEIIEFDPNSETRPIFYKETPTAIITTPDEIDSYNLKQKQYRMKKHN